MFNLKNLLLKTDTQEPEHAEYDTDERLKIATCVILLEVARSDDEFCSMEKATLSAIMQKEFQIHEEAVDALIEVSQRKREESVDLYQFTKIVNEQSTLQEKIHMVELAWQIIYADTELNRYEDHFAHKLARLLRLQHEDLIQAKMKVLNRIRT
jgi:uncharacterized tellurite resistance protein B-like protein